MNFLVPFNVKNLKKKYFDQFAFNIIWLSIITLQSTMVLVYG